MRKMVGNQHFHPLNLDLIKMLGTSSKHILPHELRADPPRKDVAEMAIIFCASLIVPNHLMFVRKSGKHVFWGTPIIPESFMIVSSINVVV